MSVVMTIVSCGTPPTPFVPENASISVNLKNSRDLLQSADTAFTDSVGNTVQVGVCPHLYTYIDSVQVTMVDFNGSRDSVISLKHFASDIDTVWLSFTFVKTGTYHLAVELFQGSGKPSASGIITILGKSVFASISPATDSGLVDSLASFTVTPQGDKPFTYQWYHGTSALSGKTGVSLIINHRAIADSGMYTCKVWDKWGDSTITNAAHLIVTSEVIVITNRKPQISVTGHSTILSFEVCSLTVAATDPDSGDIPTYSVIKAPTGYTFSDTLFTWAPYTGYLGSDSMKIDTAIFAVTDNGKPPLSDTQKVFIIVSAKIFQPDSVKGIAAVSRYNGNFVFKWNKSANADEYAIYRSRDATGFTKYGTTQDTTFANNIRDTAFYYYVIATNSKKSSPPSSQIRSTDINTAPKWLHAGTIVTINEGSSFSFDCADSCKDTNGDDITYQLSAAGSVNDSLIGSTWRYSPSYSDAGVKTVKIKATDGIDSSFLTITVTVVNVPRPPQPQPQNLSTKRDTPLQITLTAFDPDGDAVTSWTIDTATTHGTAVLTSASQPAVTYTPTAGFIGTDYFTFKASIGSLSSTYSAKVSIKVDTNNIAPKISQKLIAKTLNKGDSLILTITINADAFPAPSYIWYKQGTKLDSTMTNSWNKSQLALADSGLYYVIVKNVAGRDSSGAKLTMQFAPTISPKLSAATTVNEGTATAMSVTVNADATPSPTYQWYFNGDPLPNAKSSSYSKTWSITDTGSYMVMVSNAAGKDSSLTKLVVNVAPGTPVLTFPSANATGVSVSPTLAWNAVPGAVTYRVQVSTASDFATSGSVLDDSTLAGPPRAVGPLNNGIKYYWRVNAKNAVGAGGWATGAFTTIKKFALTVNTANGTVAANPTGLLYDSGSVVKLTATPSTGFHFTSWTGDLTSTATLDSITMRSAKTVTATFSINTFSITASTGSNGSVTPSGVTTVSYNGSQAYSITPSTGYHVTGVLVDGTPVGAVTSYNFTNVIANRTISATFAINTYTITASAGANGTISPNGATVVNYGGSISFTTTPSLGYQVGKFQVDGDSVSHGRTLTLSNVTANHTVAVSFRTIHWDQVDGAAYVTSFATLGQNVYMAGGSSGVLQSTDSGASWSQVNANNLSYLAVTGSDIYAAGSGVYHSTNGTTWNKVSDMSVQCLTACNGYVFAGTADSGVHISHDVGATWTKTNTNLSDVNITALTNLNNYVVVGNATEGTYRMYYTGALWIRDGNSLSVPVTCLAAGAGYIFAGSTGNGVYRSSDYGSTWGTAVNTDIVDPMYQFSTNGTVLLFGHREGASFSNDNGTTFVTDIAWPRTDGTIGGSPAAHVIKGVGYFGNYIFCSDNSGTYRTVSP